MDRWSELRTNILATSNVLAMVDGIASELKGAHRRNTERWEREGLHASLRAQVGVSLEDEVKLLKDWITGRLNWIDSQDFPSPVTEVVHDPASPIPELKMASLLGRIYYTVDGSDTRAAGGQACKRGMGERAPSAVAAHPT